MFALKDNCDPRSVLTGLALGRLRVLRSVFGGVQLTKGHMVAVKKGLTEYFKEIQDQESVDLHLGEFEVMLVSEYDRMTIEVVSNSRAQAIRTMPSPLGVVVV